MSNPIRVLHVVVNMNAGGIENMLMNLYRAIDKEKIQFDFLFHTGEKCFFEDEIIALGGVIHRVRPLRIHNLKSYKEELKSFFKINNYKIVHSHISVWSYFVLNIAKQCNVEYRIAHSHEAHDSIWDHRLHRIPLIWTLKKIINRPLTHRFACGEEAGKWLFGKYDFNVINNSIDAKKFEFNPTLASKIKNDLGVNDKIVLGNIGRFNLQKNHAFILKVMEELVNNNKNIHLILVGDGELRGEILSEINKRNLKNFCTLLGIRKDVDKILQALDIVIMPSLFEGLPVSLVEAQASGVKILASDKISVETNFTGDIEFLPINNPSIWAERILKYNGYERPNNVNKVINAGYDVYQNAFTLTNFYESIINER